MVSASIFSDILNVENSAGSRYSSSQYVTVVRVYSLSLQITVSLPFKIKVLYSLPAENPCAITFVLNDNISGTFGLTRQIFKSGDYVFGTSSTNLRVFKANPLVTFGACSTAGELRFNTANNVLTYCNGTNYLPAGPSPGAASAACGRARTSSRRPRAGRSGSTTGCRPAAVRGARA